MTVVDGIRTKDPPLEHPVAEDAALRVPSRGWEVLSLMVSSLSITLPSLSHLVYWVQRAPQDRAPSLLACQVSSCQLLRCHCTFQMTWATSAGVQSILAFFVQRGGVVCPVHLATEVNTHLFVCLNHFYVCSLDVLVYRFTLSIYSTTRSLVLLVLRWRPLTQWRQQNGLESSPESQVFLYPLLHQWCPWQQLSHQSISIDDSQQIGCRWSQIDWEKTQTDQSCSHASEHTCSCCLYVYVSWISPCLSYLIYCGLLVR